MAVFEIETDHFILFKMADGGQEKYFQLSRNPNVMKFVTGNALSRSESDEMYESFLDDNSNEDYFGRYFIKNKLTGELVGTAKLEFCEDSAEIGYRLMEHYWGKGYGTEIAEGLVNCCKQFLPKLHIIAFVDSNNRGSIRVLEKAGMVLTDTIILENEIRLKYAFLPSSKLTRKKILFAFLGLILVLFISALIMLQ